MFTLRVVRHDRPEQLLAEVNSAVVPCTGEMLLLETLDAEGTLDGPSTCWRVVGVTLHVPSIQSSRRRDGKPHAVTTVEVAVRPDVIGIPDLNRTAQEILSEPRM
jgi:hypothetical protein